MKRADPGPAPPASELISRKIAELGDWRGETLARMRALIHEAVACNRARAAKPAKRSKR